VLAIVAFTVASLPAPAQPAAPVLPAHAVLVDRPGLRVYGPANYARVACPHLVVLPPRALSTVKRAVELAMPTFERSVRLDGRDAVVTVGPPTKSGFSSVAAGCGPTALARTDWTRSVFANVDLTHVRSASLSQHRFAVGRTKQGWVIWGYIH
jgi:hypothetical protein